MMTASDGGRDDVESLPPSCRYVLRELDRAEGELSRQALDERLEHHPRTIRRALAILEEAGKLRRDRDPRDLREIVVTTATTPGYNTTESDT